MDYGYIVQMLQQEYDDHTEILERIMVTENRDNSHSFMHILWKSCNEVIAKSRNPDATLAYRTIVSAVSDYVRGYPAPAPFKQELFKRLHSLCTDIGKHNCINKWEEHIKNIAEPLKMDVDAELIKALHDQKGLTKEELAQKLNISEKIVRDKIGQLPGNSGKSTIRFGGVAVNLDVERIVPHQENSKLEDKHKFYTVNTMSPVFYQLNITQAATLLQSFCCCYFEAGKNVALEMAIDTWWQLSEYAKERIEEYFGKSDPSFNIFLNTVKKESATRNYHFMTESEMLKGRVISDSEKLSLAWKGGLICDIVLTKNRCLKKHKVNFDFERKSYYAVPADDLNGARVAFADEELEGLYESL